jgi:integrase
MLFRSITVNKSTRPRRADKPKKPHKDFPLFPHATRRWAKKIKGRTWYFGSWADGPQAALDRYLAEKDIILAGGDPRAAKPDADTYTLGKLCNQFLNVKQAAVDRGTLTARRFGDLHQACARLVDFFGAGRAVESVGPDDFERYGLAFPAAWKLRRRKREIGDVRSVFTYAAAQEKIVRTRFGTFRAPGKKELAVERQGRERQHGTREFTPEQLRKVLDAAPLPLKAMILLGVNCGYGNTDCSTLPNGFLDLDRGMVSYPRPKTSVERRAFLWPETVEALRAAIARRPEPKDPQDAGLVFITTPGLRWVRTVVRQDAQAGNVAVKSDDSISREFRELLQDLGLHRKGLSFYSLRHCCETHGGIDQVAIDRVMGHETPGMGSNYRQSISDERLKAVADIIHAWLFGTQTSSVQ